MQRFNLSMRLAFFGVWCMFNSLHAQDMGQAPTPQAAIAPEAYSSVQDYSSGAYPAYEPVYAPARKRVFPPVTGMWGGAELLMWWNKGRDLPAIVTTSPNGTSENNAGVLGLNSTSVLFGNEIIGSDMRLGGRFNLGLWFGEAQNAGLGVRFTAMDSDTTGYDNIADGTSIVAQPFYAADLNSENSLLIGYPATFSGEVHVQTKNDFLMNDLYGRFRMHDTGSNSIDLLIGYQFARLDDNLTMNRTVEFIDPGDLLFGAVVSSRDQFRTTNEYHGAELGLMGERRNGRAKMSWLGKLGYGNMRQQFHIDGNSDITISSVTTPINGGLYAQGTNIGDYVRDRSVWVPEVNVNLNYQLTRRWDVSVGYSLVYFSSVALAPDQLDRRVNITQQQSGGLVGPAQPVALLDANDFWFMGLNFGANYNW